MSFNNVNMKKIAQRILYIIQLIARWCMIIVFIITLLWILYYFVKTDFPPQEVRELITEIFPRIQDKVNNSNVIRQILEQLEISVDLSSTQ